MGWGLFEDSPEITRLFQTNSFDLCRAQKRYLIFSQMLIPSIGNLWNASIVYIESSCHGSVWNRMWFPSVASWFISRWIIWETSWVVKKGWIKASIWFKWYWNSLLSGFKQDLTAGDPEPGAMWQNKQMTFPFHRVVRELTGLWWSHLQGSSRVREVLGEQPAASSKSSLDGAAGREEGNSKDVQRMTKKVKLCLSS